MLRLPRCIQCVALVAIAGDREPAMLLWERRAGGRGMPLKYLQPRFTSAPTMWPHILPWLGFRLGFGNRWHWLRLHNQVLSTLVWLLPSKIYEVYLFTCTVFV